MLWWSANLTRIRKPPREGPRLLLAYPEHGCMPARSAAGSKQPETSITGSGAACGLQGRVYRSQDFTLDSSYGAIPSLSVPFSHPQTAGSHMLDLDPAKNYTPTVGPQLPDSAFFTI